MKRSTIVGIVCMMLMCMMQLASGQFLSDDFSAATINTSLWTVVNPLPASTIDLTGTGTTDALLRFQVPASSHDVWVGGNFAPRLMQTCGNTDFTAEVKFQSTLSSAYQMQGIIVEQDANNYLRFDFLRTPAGLFTYSASFSAGNPTQRINAGVTGSNPMWLRVNRTSNTWTMSYSANGTLFTTAGTYSQALTVGKIGPFAGNAGSPAPATTVLVDYFFNTASPINPEDPVGPVISTQPTDQTVSQGSTATFSLVATGGTLAYQWQKNNANIGGATNTSYTTPATVHADSGATFRCIVSNANGTVTSNSAILNVLPPATPSTIISDDFHTGTLNGALWTYVNPFADATISLTGANTVDALLNIALPAGTAHDLFTNGYQVPRIMQNANNTDFTVEAKFQSTFTAQYESEGIVVEQDANNVIRFDIFYDGANTNVFASSFVGGFAAPTIHVNTVIGAGAQNPAYLRINRAGSVWTVSTSFDGTTFTPAGNFTLSFTVTKVGVWAGNSGTNPAFTMLCDYFFNNASPIVPEDPVSLSGPVITQQPANQTVNEGQTAGFTIVANGNPTPTYQWQKNNANIGGATSAVYATPATVFADSGSTFRCIVSNTQGTVTSNSAILSVHKSGPSVTQQPRDTTVQTGQTAAFSVTASGSPTLVYQWQKNNANIGGATNSSYTTPATVHADSGATFRCIVSNSAGTVTSNSAILTVLPAATPSTIVSDDFHTGTLNGALWTYVNPLADATLSLTGANTADALLNIAIPAGTAHDLYSNGYQVPRIMQNANNTDFTVQAKFQSIFTAQYESEGIVVEQDANNVIRFDIFYDGVNTKIFAASFIGGFGSPTNYLNATIGTGAQNPAYLRINRAGNVWTVSTSFDGITFTQAGNFTLAFTVTKVGVWAGTAGSNPAFTMLCDYFFNNASPIVPEDPSVLSAPTITQQPTNQTINEGLTASFSVVANGNPAPTFQWQKNNANIGGATSANYTTPATVFADSGATFRCIVSNTQGTVTSNSAILSVNRVAPSVTQQPRDTTVQAGQTAAFSVTATGSPTLAYQWQKNNANIGGATSVNYTTPATVVGDNGSTFRCIVSNAIGTVTSNSATLTVNSQPAGTIVSDDFHTGVLNTSLWTFTNPSPASTMSFTGVGTTDALLSIAIPAGGTGHDVWTGGNFAPRIMQPISNGDFQAEVKFQSALTAAYQMQGIIVEQDANNYLRFDFLRTPGGLAAFSASFTAGNPTQRISTNITGATIMWLRVTRSANNWTMAYSTDGSVYTTAGTYAQALTVSKIGPFAGNASGASSPAFTCLVDYFFNTAFPVNPEDPTGPVAPAITTQPTNQSVPLGQTATFNVVATGTAPLAYQWQKNNANIGGATNANYTTPATVQADSGATFKCIVSNAGGTVTSNPAILSVLPPATPSTIVSDDFHTGTLNGALWTYVNPLADATLSLTGANTADALLNIAIPAGTAHDLYSNGYQVPRIMQNANNTDFTVQAKFQSIFTAQYESEGIVVEQDANNVIRFDIFYDGANTNVFASSFIGGFGAPTIHVNAQIGTGGKNPAYLRINRTGNSWTVSTSFDGTTFTQAGNFTLAFTVAKVGVWGGNSGTNPAFTMLCDYFFNNASPIVPEDPSVPTAPVITQQPTNQTVNEGLTASFSVVANGNPAPTFQWQKNNANIGGATSANYTTPATVFADSGATFRCIVSNTQGTVTSNSAILSVNRVAPSVTQQPRDTTVQAGQTAAFSVTATGSPTLAYQWQKNNANIGGATNSSYTTPATVAGDNASTFRCIVSNSIGTATSNSATLTVNSQPAGTIVSDDFHTGVLNTSLWTFTNPSPASTMSFTGVGTTDALLSIAIPAGGTGHDVWTGGNFAPRIMQPISNGDFQAEVKFQSALTAAYQMQGIIVEQDANNYLRFDFLRTPGGLAAFSASFTAGNPTQRISTNITGATIMWLRVTRSANNWTMAYSTDGTTYTTAGTYAQALTVAKIGPFAGNASGASSPALTCLIDYFFNTAFPVNPEDPTGPVPPAITTQPTNQSVPLGQTATFNVVATGTAPLAYQWQKNNANIGGATNANYTTPATVQADSGATFKCIVSNAGGTVTSNPAILSVLPPATPSTIVSDDFHTGTLNGALWTYVNPLADATMSLTGANTVDALLNIAIPGGTAHDLFTNGYQVPRIMQNANNTDFTVEAKFQSTFTGQYESEGIVVEQDANNVIRFDIFYDGANTNVFASSFIGGFGAPTIHVNAQIGTGGKNPAYLRINRTGNSWTVSTSFDGTTFTQAGNFTLAFTVAKVGVWGGNSGTNPAFTMLCDYFFNNASPIVPEDPSVPTAPVITQQPTNQTVNEGLTASFSVVANGNPAPTFQWQKNNANIGGATSANYTTPATAFADSGSTFRCVVSNTQGTVTSNNAILSVHKVGPSVTQQPRDTTVQAGQTAAFSVTATGSPTLAYQWQKNNANIGGATNSSYTTPATVAGDNASTFRCIVSNSIGTATSNAATLTVNSQPAGTIVSDDFHTGVLNTSLWTFTNPSPASTMSFTGVGTTDALLSIAIPAGGTGHDVWTGGNFAPRIMQPISNGDFQAEVKFQSALTAAYQMQGIIVEQDANNYLRFDFLRTPGGLAAFSASFTAGNPTQRISTNITGATIMWLRVTRSANNWTMAYSTDGTTYTTAGTYAQALTVAKIGPFAGNASGASSPALTCLIDYFFNTAFPVNPEDPTGPVPPAITTQPTNQSVPLGQTATFNVVATGTAPLAYQWQKNNANIGGATNANYTTPATVQADSGATFKCIVSNAGGTVTSNPAILSVLPPATPSTIVSDDFHTGTLNGALWTYVNPLADATMSLTGANTVDALLNIAIPGGTAHDLFTNGYQVPRIMQNANNTDFTVEAKFQSTFTGQYESEGIVVEQDANNVIRFDIFYDGANTNVFASSFIGGFGAPTIHVNAQIGTGGKNPAYLRINRTGNSWTVSTSFDGTTFTQAGNFTLAFTVAKVGVWGGNSGTNPAFTMLCDYFFNNASPIVPEDPTGPPAAPTITQQPANQTVNEGQTATFSIVANGNPVPTYQWQKNNANIGGATSANYTTPATAFADSGSTFRCIVSNTQGTVTSNNAILSVHKVGPSVTQQPRDTTVQAGQTAAFSVTATGSPTLAYQWQKNNANIGGATNSSYTTPATVAGDNASTFRCIVSNSIGTVTSNAATLTVNSQPAGTIVSDDFHAGSLNNALWTFTNPNSPSTLSFVGVGTTDALLSIAVPAGGSGHDVWTGGNFAPRIMQPISNGDFQAEVKFQSALTAAYQMEGIIVEQDANNYLRFDFLRTPSGLFTFSASFTAGNPTQRINAGITGAAIMWMRVTRSGNNWTMAWSTNGTTFTTAGTYAQTLTVAKIGPFAGNASGASSPALTCLIDYFFNTAFPINPEDPTGPSVGPPITQNPSDATVTEGGRAVFTVAASGSPLNYQWQKDGVNIPGANAATCTSAASVSTDNGSAFRCLVSNTLGTSTSNPAILTVNSLSGTGLNVWYSTPQTFGSVGHPIPFVNIVGHVADPSGIQSVTYTLNGGAATDITPMVKSSDGRRIDQLGDFNIEIPRTSLNNGANTVVVTLTNTLSVVTTKTVTVNYAGGTSWPLPYSINWSLAASVQSVAQPSDGFWSLDSNGVRVVKPGYDRLLTIGDPGWTNYEVSFAFTVHSFVAAGFGYPSNGPGIGAIVRWNGNTDNPIAGASPRTGYLPLGSIGWYHWSTSTAGTMEMLDNNANVAVQDNSGFIPALGVRYMFKMKVFSSGAGQSPMYHMKIWPATQAEPAAWSLSYTGAPSDPSSGCVSVIAQECDATFGNVTIVPAADASRPRIGGSELVALYRFNEGDGNIIHDVSGKGTPLDLTINKTEATNWTNDGLSVNLATSISSQVTAKKVLDAVRSTNAITVEAWVRPTLVTNGTVSRLMGFGDAGNISFEVFHGLSADRSSLEVDASMSVTTLGSRTSRQSLTSSAINGDITHIVFTRDAAGKTILYVNGAEVAHGMAAGDFTGWKNAALVLGGENGWLGEYRLVAIYSRALSKAEVTQNFTGGPEAEVAHPVFSAAPTLAGPAPVIAQEVPKEFALYQNYPNPFNPATTIKFDLPKDENVSLTVFNLLGQQVTTLVNERRSAGRYTIQWNAQGFASGVYIYRIKAGDFNGTRKLVLLK